MRAYFDPRRVVYSCNRCLRTLRHNSLPGEPQTTRARPRMWVMLGRGQMLITGNLMDAKLRQSIEALPLAVVPDEDVRKVRRIPTDRKDYLWVKKITDLKDVALKATYRKRYLVLEDTGYELGVSIEDTLPERQT